MESQSQWARRLARLRSMSAAEIVDRARQAVMMRADAWRQSRGHGIGPVLTAESLGTCGNFFFSPVQLPSVLALLHQRFPSVAREIVLRAEQLLAHRFGLLGYENLDYGPDIDWHLDIVHGKLALRKPWFKVKYLDFGEVGDSKITWELNRHQHLVTLAKAYRLTGDDRFVNELLAQWKHWHAENPYPIGINWASSLEVAFRSLSWIWIYFLLADTSIMTAELSGEFLRALALSGRHIETYLSTYFSPNTHLLGEAVALFSIGALFPGFPKAARWKSRGWEIARKSAAEQVRPDGFYFEQSTYYHVYALDMFLHVRILAANNSIPIPEEFDATLVRMLDALCVLSRAGVPPMIGDDDGGRVFDGRRNCAEHLFDPLCTGAVLFQRGDFKFFVGGMREETLWLLGEKGLDEFENLKTSDPSTASVGLRESGLYLMADVETGQQLFVDAGPHGPGHGHADALSIQLIRNGRVSLMDPGTFEYLGEGDERVRYRGTSAHNTMLVDGLDQAEGKGPFAWASVPSVKVEKWVTGNSFNLLDATHNGYERLPQPVTHRRIVFHRKGQFWLVRDVAAGNGTHRLELLWHLGPGLSPESTKDNLFSEGQDKLAFITAEGHGWAQSGHRGAWSPVYGRQEKAMVLTFAHTGTLPEEFVTILLPDASLRPGLGRFERMPQHAGVHEYRYLRDQQEHYFFFADARAAWSQGNWTSDARFLYWSCDRERDVRLLVICEGTYAEVNGARVLASEQVVDYAEVISFDGKTEMHSSNAEHVSVPGSLDRVEMELATAGVKHGPSV
jgi:Heparinase II/III-like protein/Heparinase II/III N-terminus